MKTILLLAILGLSLLLVGCASSTQNKSHEAETDTTVTTQPTPAPPALAPGNAHVSATVVGYQAEQNAYVCTLKIKQVHRYGASTPPLPVGAEIAVLMRKTLFGDDPDGTKAAEQLQTGQEIEVTLKRQQVPEGGTAPPWRAVQLH